MSILPANFTLAALPSLITLPCYWLYFLLLIFQSCFQFWSSLSLFDTTLCYPRILIPVQGTAQTLRETQSEKSPHSCSSYNLYPRVTEPREQSSWQRHRKPTEEFYELTLFKVAHHKINIYFSADLAVEAEDLLGDRQINACSRAGTLERWQKQLSWRNGSSGNGNNTKEICE